MPKSSCQDLQNPSNSVKILVVVAIKEFLPNQIKIMKKTRESNETPEQLSSKQSNIENCKSTNEEKKQIIIHDDELT